MTFIAVLVCVHAYGLFLFIAKEWVRYVGCQSRGKMKIVMCAGMLVSRGASC